MIRKLLVVATAVAMPISVIAAFGGTSGAAAVKVDATHYTVTCSGISGTVKFSPPVTTNESAGSGTTSIKAVLTGCTATPTAGGTAIAITSAKVSGSLTTTRTAGENGCVALAGGSTATGTLTTKWKTTPKLLTATSSISVNSISGGVGSDGNASFQIPGTVPNGAASGAFQGTDSGNSDNTSAQTTEPALTGPTSLLATCEGKKGLKKLSIETPQTGNAVSLG